MDEIALIVRDDERLVIAGGERVAAGSLAARVLEARESAFVCDTGALGPSAPRLRDATLLSGGRAVGVLAVERCGDISTGERAALETIGAHVGVALENARLVSRQRRFAAELQDRVGAARRELEEPDRAKSAFVAIASHELRTPLTRAAGLQRDPGRSAPASRRGHAARAGHAP